MQVADPVCGMQIDSTQAVARESYEGQTYYFCSPSCRDKFCTAPERYVKKENEDSHTG